MLVGDRVEDRVARLLRAPVSHREDAVWPVRVRRSLVAVGDAADGGHSGPHVHDLLLRDPPDAHAVGRETGAAMEEDRGHTAQYLAVNHAPQVLEERVR